MSRCARNSALGLIVLATFGSVTITSSAEPSSRHPVLKHIIDPASQARLTTEVREFVATPEAELVELVPRQTPFISCDCPACGNQTYQRGLDRLVWEFTFPDRIKCLRCGETFPSEKYPADREAKYLNTLGESVVVRFHQNAKGEKFFIPAAIDSFRSGRLVAQVEAAAKLYHLTKDEALARRVALLLDRYAQFFPHYLVKDFLTLKVEPPGERGPLRSLYEFRSTGGPWLRDGRPSGKRPSEPEASQQQTSTPYGWTQSRWGWGRWNNESPLELLDAYDLVYDSPVFAKLSQEMGADVRKRIETDLFRNAVGYLREFPFWYFTHNNAGYEIRDIIRVGQVLGDAEYVAFGARWCRDVLEQYAFSRDATFGESPGYFYVFLATKAENFTALQEATEQFRAQSESIPLSVDADLRKATDFLKRAGEVVESIRFPNGSSMPLGDNRHDEFVEPTSRPGVRGVPRTDSSDVLLAGYGHALLGAGAGDRQVQAHLHFSPFKEVIHTHADGLSLMLWAFGAELFTDVGYNRTKYRTYSGTTLSHNTVIVDRARQDGEETKGKLLAYAHDPRGLSFIQVEDAGAYGPPVERYRRTLLLNTFDLEAPYLVDVFEVRGGLMHDYALHGPTLYDSTLDVDLTMTPVEGERPLLEPGEDWKADPGQAPYGAFTKVREGRPTDAFTTTFRLVKPYELPEYTPNERYKPGPSLHYEIDPKNYADKGEIGVRSHFIGLSADSTSSTKLLVGDTLSLIRGGLYGGPLTEKLMRPSLLLRRTSSNKLTSVYIAVHEPYYRAPKITAVRKLKTFQKPEQAVALEIERSDRTDVVLLTLDGERTIVAGHNSAELQGRLGVVCRPQNGDPTALIVGGTQLKQRDLILRSDVAAYQGNIDGVSSVWSGDERNAFTTSAKLPLGEVLAGRWIYVAHGNGQASEGYEIAKVEVDRGRTIIHLKHDPGLRISDGETRELFFPRRSWKGANRFVIFSQTER